MNLLRRFSILQRLVTVTLLVLIIVLGLVTVFAVDYHKTLLDGRAIKTNTLLSPGWASSSISINGNWAAS
ncbi:hypothetical protein LL270_01085 [Pseudomonas aestusnigri]|jgi:methyl-accepting chemotaxis protein|uniref:hypothetical protein n=1 Tax=Halopseudomonas aestusnigri TaxID=857252 RepID=UPI001D185AD3|nr:hypothetical protein [Halopseudomonas aestusnigri]MCC4259247.1 hypothetical protein [Halopseudomonas aestusnigri]